MPTRIRTPMNTIVLTLLGIVIIATLAFLALLFRLSLDDADFWLKVISGVLAAFTFLAGAAALVIGTISGNRQSEKVLILEKETADAKLAYLELQEHVRKEQEARALLELVVTPREIDGRKYGEFSKRLKPFAGTLVEVLATDEREPRGVAEMIAQLLTYSGWKVTMLEPTKEFIGDGVHIHFTPDRPRAILPVASELHAVLSANRIVTRNVPSAMPNQPPNTVRILVGPPDTFQLRTRNKTQP